MELYNKTCITLDGRLDEAEWKAAKAYTGFKQLKDWGGAPVPADTFFHILPCEDRVYFGIKCCEPDIVRCVAGHSARHMWGTDSVELFISPTGDPFEFYQFLVTMGGQSACNFHSEGGNIHPDPYAPLWNYATYIGEDYWSAEVEIPLTAFYMTPNSSWSSNWLLNICRTRPDYNADGATQYYTWSDLVTSFLESARFNLVEGFPMRPEKNDVRIISADVEIHDKTEKAFVGDMIVNVTVLQDGEYIFSSESADETKVTLKAGSNEFAAPCCFEKDNRQKVDLQLVRKSDGEIFKRWYPVRVSYEPIKLELTLPEFRGNFYPGQDHSRVMGRVIANKAVTVTLEGPGIGTKTVTPDADGNFVVETPDFEVGEALLTITDSVNTLTKKIRNLAPTGRTMAWISGGNLVVNGKPVLRRNMYAEYYHGGEAFKLKYDADNLHDTKGICGSKGFITPGRLMKGSDAPGGEATKDKYPCEEMLRLVDAVIQNNQDRDFVYYYLDDEPECRGVSPVYLKHMYEYITDKDPYHVVLIGTRSAGSLVECADWFETHPYINVEVRDGKRSYQRPINTMGRFVDQILKVNRSDKCVGFLPTCFAYKYTSVYSEYPNLDEMICHTWAAVLAGAKTLWPYAYHDLNDRASLYEGIRYIFSTFEALEDLVLLAKRKELIRNNQVHAVHFELNGEKMFVLANIVAEPQEVTLDGISGTWYDFRHNGTVTGNSFSLKPFEVIVGTTKVRDMGLPTYQETDALINKMEYERTHTDSLFFDRQCDMVINGNSGMGRYKLFDGVRDNYAWECNGKDMYLEMDITKFKPTFSKVVVGGFQIEDMELKIRMDGKLSVPVFKEVKTEQFSKTFLLVEPVCPDALRLEFGEHRVELYEIEAF